MKRILDPSFRYTPSYATDVRRTFERIRRDLESQDGNPGAARKDTAKNVVPLGPRKTSPR